MKITNRNLLTILAAFFITVLSSCTKDPLEGTWRSEHMDLTFNTQESKVDLLIPAQNGLSETRAYGTYSIDVQEKLLITVTHHIDSNMDYSERSAANGEYQLASIMLKEGNLILSDFYGTSLTLSGGTGDTIQNISGTWSYEEPDAKIELTLDPVASTFLLQEYSSDIFITDENGVVLQMKGIYRTETFTAISMNMKNEVGFPYYSCGEIYFSPDKKTLHIDGQDFYR